MENTDQVTYRVAAGAFWVAGVSTLIKSSWDHYKVQKCLSHQVLYIWSFPCSYSELWSLKMHDGAVDCPSRFSCQHCHVTNGTVQILPPAANQQSFPLISGYKSPSHNYFSSLDGNLSNHLFTCCQRHCGHTLNVKHYL